MKLPIRIEYLWQMIKWVDKYQPKIIEIPHNAKIKRLVEFNGEWGYKWRRYRGIKLRYLR